MSSKEGDPQGEASGGGEFAVPPFLGPSGYSESDRAEILRHLAVLIIIQMLINLIIIKILMVQNTIMMEMANHFTFLRKMTK